MANQQHLEMLRQGEHAWNALRRRERGVQPDLTSADLKGTDLSDYDLRHVNLRGADLSEACLVRTDLTWAKLEGADLSGATIGWAAFGDADLSQIKGLETIHHAGPSSLGVSTIFEGNIPETFLRGTGASDHLIEFLRAHAQKL